MENLPVEIIQRILKFLDAPALLETICVDYLRYSVGIEVLYSNITLYADPYTGDLDLKSTRLLMELYSERDVRGVALYRMRAVRSISLLPSPKPRFQVKPHAFRTLNMVVFQLLQVKSIQCSLRTFRWQTGYSEELRGNPIAFPQHLRALECLACQIDPTVLFPALKRLSLRQLKSTNGDWVSRQARYSTLKHLCLSGISSADRVPVSSCSSSENNSLSGLHHLSLEYVHLDTWPLPPTARLRELVIRSCSHSASLYRVCEKNLPDLEALTLISDQDVRWCAVKDFQRMLWSCRKLRTLVLLLAGRIYNIPLRWIRPLRFTLETLVLEARLVVMAPTMSVKYALVEVEDMTIGMPKLKFLGLPIDLNAEEAEFASSTCLSKLQGLQLRNWLYPQQIACTLERVAKVLYQNQAQSQCDTVIVLASGECYKLSNPHRELGNSEEHTPYAEQVDDAPYRNRIISWV